ncbi:hypothetical protein IG631_05666 [Alternaria alternata]|nr:hypothetical protein IG631_05666 [Alternaria alternata]
MLTSYAYGSGGRVYCGADIAPYSKGCCSEAKTVGVEMRGKRTNDNIDMPRMMPAPQHDRQVWNFEYVRQNAWSSPTGCSRCMPPDRV